MMQIAVTGAAGRMGKEIIGVILSNPELKLCGALESAQCALLGIDAGEAAGAGKGGVKITDSPDRAFKKADVIIDFSAPEASMRHLEFAAHYKKAIVIGTTGFSHGQREKIKELSAGARVLMSPNMSIGVNLLFKLVSESAKALGKDYDIEITEAHHRHKKDAPSGTAMRIAEVIAGAINCDLEKAAVYGRKGIIGERRPEEIGILSIRAGDIVGDHTVLFGGPGERIEITHKASSRETFARGAVKAAVWLAGKPEGLYDMQDVLGLK
jgi:4-hydroxy-tetrahydrodipicolinate reductase